MKKCKNLSEAIKHIVPMATPLDQLSRCGNVRTADDTTVNYDIAVAKERETQTTAALTEGCNIGGNLKTYIMKTKADTLFNVGDTVVFPAKTVTALDGAKSQFMVYVYGHFSTGGVEVVPITFNEQMGMGQVVKGIPVVAAGERVVIMSRGDNITTAKGSNYCQAFRKAITPSVLTDIPLDEERWLNGALALAAAQDFRQCMENCFLFGKMAKTVVSLTDDDYASTGGIWEQTTHEHELTLSDLTADALDGLCASAFACNVGSKRKYLIAGSGLMKALGAVVSGKTVEEYGIEFKQYESIYGTLCIAHSEAFDRFDHADDGFIVDLAYLAKYVNKATAAEQIETADGTEGKDLVDLSETSCLVLLNLDVHTRVIGKTN